MNKHHDIIVNSPLYILERKDNDIDYYIQRLSYSSMCILRNSSDECFSEQGKKAHMVIMIQQSKIILEHKRNNKQIPLVKKITHEMHNKFNAILNQEEINKKMFTTIYKHTR